MALHSTKDRLSVESSDQARSLLAGSGRMRTSASGRKQTFVKGCYGQQRPLERRLSRIEPKVARIRCQQLTSPRETAIPVFSNSTEVDLTMVRVDANLITDWHTFHSVFAEKFGFPGFYGRNMDAWVDCLSYLDDPSAEMSSVHVQSGQTLSLVIDNAQSFKHRCPEQFEALVECAAFVNWRVIVSGGSPILALAFNI